MNIFDISEVEDTVKEIVRGLGISAHVYSNRPKATLTEGDFVVVAVSGSVYDNGAYGNCNVGVDLFARDANAVKNSKRLSVMYQKLIEGFPASHGRYEFSINPRVLRDYPDDFGYHARMVNINTLIKVR